jgi:hypothetical protein
MLMNARKSILAAAVALTAGAVGFTGIAPSYAGAMSSAAPVQKSGYQAGDLLQDVASRKKYSKNKYKKRWAWNRHKHGKRFRHKQRGYSYYYGGYWYPKPFWRTEPGIYIRIM